MRRRPVYVLASILLVATVVDFYVIRDMGAQGWTRNGGPPPLTRYPGSLDPAFNWARPYITKTETHLYKSGYGYPENEPWKYTKLTLQGTTFEFIRSNLAKSLRTENEWYPQISENGLMYIHPAPIDQTITIGDAYVRVSWSEDFATITSDRHLSHAEVMAIRNTRPGVDPFESRPPAVALKKV